MEYYFAPMEGVTGYLYRGVHHSFFPGVDKYFAPFVVANQTGKLKNRESRDVLPENNKGIPLVPQILSNSGPEFLQAAEFIKNLGYEEINLNLGCPSGTVVAKKKGSGLLSDLERLDHFLEEIYEKTPVKLSIKTRLGITHPEEFYEIIEIYNKYPIEELIIHPRVQQDFYKNIPRMELFKEMITKSKNPLCYNGDLFCIEDLKQLQSECNSIDRVMLGRGLIANPGLVCEAKQGLGVNKDVLRKFHDVLYQEYQEEMSGERNVLFKMKEAWFYMSHMFTNHEKYLKKIRKCQRLTTYEEIVNRLFSEEEILLGKGFMRG